MREEDDDRHARSMLAILGLRDQRPELGVRLLMAPAFHDVACVSIDPRQGLIEYHRLPKETLGQLLYDHRWLRLAVNPAELEPVAHPQDVTELPPQVWQSLRCAIEAIPAHERSLYWDWRGRDGAHVRIECFYPDRVETIGRLCILGHERPNHRALVCTILEAARGLFPKHHPHLSVLRRYGDD